MTIQKKLISIGVALSFLIVIFIWNSGGITGNFLKSAIIAPTPPTIKFTAKKAASDVGVSDLVITKGNQVYYTWEVTGATSVTSKAVSNKPAVCGADAPVWIVTTTNKVGNLTTAPITAAQAGCLWTVTITAQNANNGTSASKDVTINYSIPNPTVALFVGGDKKTIDVVGGGAFAYNWQYAHANKVTSITKAVRPSQGCDAFATNMNVAALSPAMLQSVRVMPAAISANYAGCEWTTTIKAEHTTTGKHDTDTVTIKYPVSDPIVTLTANGKSDNLVVNTGDVIKYNWTSKHATKVTVAANVGLTSPSVALCGVVPGLTSPRLSPSLADLTATSTNQSILAKYEGCSWTVRVVAENANTGKKASKDITVRFPDKTRPIVNSFSLGAPTNYQVPIIAFTATDPALVSTVPTSVSAYLITESNTPPNANDSRWSTQVPRTYTATKEGNVDLYPWVKDLAGNISSVSSLAKTVSIAIPDSQGPTVSIRRKAEQSALTDNRTIQFLLTFSEEIRGNTFVASDFEIVNASNVRIAPAPSDTVKEYVVTVDAVNVGQVGISMLANKVNDLAGNNNLASTSADNGVLYAQVPGTVTNVKPEPGNGKIVLNWSAPVSNGGTPIKGYSVEYTAGNTGIYSVPQYVTGTNTVLTGLVNNTSYTVRIKAQNAIGYSLPMSVQSTPIAGMPEQVTGLTAHTENAQLALSWNEPNNNGAAIDYYVVEYKKNTQTTWTTKRVIDFNNTVIQNLENGVTYTVKVSAHNAKGLSPSSATISAIPNKIVNTDKAILVTNMLGANNDLKFISKISGISGNLISVILSKPVTPIPNTTLSVTTDNVANTKNVLIQLATDADGNVITTAAQVKSLVEVNTQARTLLDVVYLEGNNGAGIVTSMDSTLSGVMDTALTPACTGNRPTNSTVMMGIGSSTVSQAWVHDPSPTGPYRLCTFQCPNGTVYNSSNNSCAGTVNTYQDPIGTHDAANCSLSTGWACDSSNYASPLIIHFYADGPYGNGGTFLGQTTANIVREAAVGNACGGNSAHGFSYSIPPSLRTGTNRTLYAYAIGIGGGSATPNPLLSNSPRTINCPVLNYTVTFNTNGGSTIAPLTNVAHNTAIIIAPTPPTKAGNTFAGWYKEPSFTTAWNFTTDKVIANTQLFAKWTINSYVVTFNTNGGSTLAQKTAQYNATITAPIVPIKLGYTFGGWYKDAGLTNAWNFATDKVTSNITLHAKWTLNSPPPSTEPPVTTEPLIAPTIVRVSSPRNNGAYRASTIIPITVEFSQPVTVTGVPTLTLETGLNDAVIPYVSTSSDGKTLLFQYVVASGHTSNDLNYSRTSALVLPQINASIRGVNGLVADRTLPALNSVASLAGNKTIIIDTTAPSAPSRPIVPQQLNITLSSLDTNTYIVTGNTMKLRVACTPGERVGIRDGISFSPVSTVTCVENPVEVTVNLPSLSAIYNFYATNIDVAGNESLVSPKIVVIKMTFYPVTYHANGATSGTIPASQTKIHNSGLVLARNTGNLEKTGYTFAGWNTSANGSGTSYTVGSIFALNASTILYAKWTPVAATYPVTYNANGATSGDIPAAQTKTHDVSLTLAANSGNLAKTGYTFAGWNTSADGTGTSYAAGTAYAGNTTITLFAKWTANNNTITFDKNDASATGTMTTQTLASGATAILTANGFTKTGFTFAGWSTSPTGTVEYTNSANYTMGTANVTLYAKWTQDTYPVTYNANGATSGDIPAAQTKTHDVSLTLAANSGNLEKTGYTFAGWNTQIDGNGTNYAVGASYTANVRVILYAKWTPNTYTVTFNSNGATTAANPTTKTVTFPATTVGNLPTNPQRTGYTFAGWYDELGMNGGGSQFVATTTVTGDTLVYAKWTQDTYPVTYNANGATSGDIPAAQTKTHDVSLTLAANSGNLEKTGYTFAGWNTQIDGNGTNYAVGASYTANASVILYAKWTVVSPVPPTVVRVTSTKANGSYRAGTIVPIAVEFSQPVTVTGVPTLILETGTNDVTVPFERIPDNDKVLLFNYVIGDGDTSTDLNYLDTNSLKLTDATITIKDKTSDVNADLTLPALTSTSSLAGNKAIVIDTTRPAAPSRPIVPQQSNITLSSTETHTYITTGNSIKVNVACTSGEKVNIRDGVSFAPITTVNCATNPVEIVLNLASQAGYYNYFATVTDAAGNESDYSPRIVVLKKQTVSDAPGMPDIDALYDLGSSSTDNITSETRPVFTVACTSGSTVNLYDNVTIIGTASCMAGTAQIIPLQPLSSGVHSITAKQSLNSTTTSSASSALSITIDTASLTVALTRATEQSEPATSATIKFTAAFNRAIDSNSFICSDVTVVNGRCDNVTLISGNNYMITITATTQGTVKATIYAGRVQTAAGNLNTESTGTNTVTYGSSVVVKTAECGGFTTLTTNKPTASSLNGKTLCKQGTPSRVSYSSSKLEWNYQCRNTTDGSSVSCKVAAILDSAPTCTAEPVELDFDSCKLKTTNAFTYYQYLTCLGITETKKSCNQLGCSQEAKRQELISIAVPLRGIPMSDDYECQGLYSDVKKTSASCETIEKARIAGLISAKNKQFRPLDTMTRAETFKVFLGSICQYPENTTSNWQNDVAKASKALGFTTRSVAAFEPNKPILRQELYVLSARVAQWKAENPDSCDDLPEELLCE